MPKIDTDACDWCALELPLSAMDHVGGNVYLCALCVIADESGDPAALYVREGLNGVSPATGHSQVPTTTT